MKQFSFKILEKDKTSRARVGEITTPHGVIETPAFVPVGTQATVKSLTPEELNQLGVELFFVNTYHAYLRPGVEIVKKAGGLHRFMNWSRPLITDSGGFQVFSLGRKNRSNSYNSPVPPLSKRGGNSPPLYERGGREGLKSGDERPMGELVKIDEDGVTFTSHWDGTKHRFTPEVSIGIQHTLGADLIIVFDECPPYPTTHEYAKKAVERTHRWAKRSLATHLNRSYLQKRAQNQLKPVSSDKSSSNSLSIKTRNRSDLQTIPYQALYGVVQGSIFQDLREQSADFISSLNFDGIAIGGVAVGESKEEMRNVCDWVIPRLPDDKPRHLLGVGEIDDIFDIVERGVDTFDCVQPTRLARMGRLFVGNSQINTNNPINKLSNKSGGKFEIDITKKTFAEDLSPVDSQCTCYTCKNFTRAYLHHLFRVRELLAYRLATIHNLHFVLTLTKHIREHIKNGTFLQFKQEFL